ncbi:DUF5666 domain-containing protein [Pararoseomonas indoligenes]|uniref:DUF5666 domain-containing protein n=1 Tax=Roseomonas indoligenes TaxID=2820811 RepID=A0A940MTU3_9PROT|nr:DUF5666 domain-containing protein [Pararoseomonas indoligenes]MBP0494013.1 hypothetical protein [Pararoseomonas indoligenes]
MSRPLPPPRAERLAFAACLAGLLLAACTAQPPAPVPMAAPAGLCRIGRDGGPPPLAEGERGIGGTGILASAEGERGIGGTGSPSLGIVGVVTGFASICVNGLHVAYDPDQPVEAADGPLTPAALRVGQVVVVEATGPDGALRARRIGLRHELAGTVEAVEDGAIRVAGQRVATAGALPAGRAWRVGEAVLVSGLRAPDGSLTATRIDPRPAGGATLVFGRLTRLGGPARIGNLPLRVAPGVELPPDGAVIARGRMQDGVLLADSVERDRLMWDPPAYFGAGRVLIEAWTVSGGGRLLLGPGLSVPAGPGAMGAPGRRVVELRGGPNGPSAAPAGRAAPEAPRGERAPMPDRGFEGRRGLERGAGGRWDSPGRAEAAGRGDRPGPDTPGGGAGGGGRGPDAAPRGGAPGR